FTAFHPGFKLRDKPRTPQETLHAARKIAREVGLHYVYEGNVFSDGANTVCPSCGQTLIQRSWHNVVQNRLKDAACPACALAMPTPPTKVTGTKTGLGQCKAPKIAPASREDSQRFSTSAIRRLLSRDCRATSWSRQKAK